MDEVEEEGDPVDPKPQQMTPISSKLIIRRLRRLRPRVRPRQAPHRPARLQREEVAYLAMEEVSSAVVAQAVALPVDAVELFLPLRLVV